MGYQSNKDPATKRSGRVLTTVLLVILAVVLLGYVFLNGYLDTYLPSSLIRTVDSGQHTQTRPSPSSITRNWGVTEADAFQYLKQKRAQPYDRRWVEGLVLAIEHYAELSSIPVRAVVENHSRAHPPDYRRYQINLRVERGSETQNVSLTLSNAPEDVQQNLQRVIDLTREITQADASASSFTNYNPSSRSEAIQQFSHGAFFDALADIDEAVAAGKLHVNDMLDAAEIFSWMSFFKNPFDYQTLSNRLAVQALSAYLLAELGKPSKNVTAYSQGLLLLAMGYPVVAEQVFAKAADTRSWMKKALSAYIHHDFKALEALLSSSNSNPRIGLYLAARAYQQAAQVQYSRPLLTRLVQDYPDFLFALDYRFEHGQIGESRVMAKPYLEELLAAHLRIIQRHVPSDWLQAQTELQFEVRSEVAERDFLAKWIRVHAQLLEKLPDKDPARGMVTTEFLKTFLADELLNAIYTRFMLEANRVSRLGEAQRIVNMTQAAYPKHPVTQTIKLLLISRYGKFDPIKHAIAKIKIKKADGLVLYHILKQYDEWKSWVNYQPALAVMDRYLATQLPNAHGLEFTHHIFFEYGQLPYALSAIRDSLALDPYRYELYRKATYIKGTDEILTKGEALIGNQYGFLIALSRYHDKFGRPEQAIDYLKRAMAIDPKQDTAYKELGELYKKTDRQDQAIEIWKEYLTIDSTSFSAVFIRNRLGNLLLDLDRVDEAYKVFDIAEESGQGSAIIGFALASERAGKLMQAEQQFRRVAERYPNSTNPVYLALFNFRQGNVQTAYDIIKEYQRYNDRYWYQTTVINHFAKLDQPDAAIQVLDGVQKDDPWANYFFAQGLREKGYVQHAKTLLERTLPISPAPQSPRPHQYFAVNYYIDALKLDPDAKQQTIARILGALQRYPQDYLFTGQGLLKSGHYDAAFEFARQFTENSDRYRWQGVQVMALAWRLGKLPEANRALIADLIEGSGGNAWDKDNLRFLIGDLTEEQILARANTAYARCAIHYELGMFRLHVGDRDAALKHFLLALETRSSSTNAAFAFAYESLHENYIDPPDND